MDDWEEIRRKYVSLVWATVYRIVRSRDQAQDVCQEVFLEAMTRSRRATIRDWPAFLRWLAVRRSLDRLRRERRAAARLNSDYDVASFARGPDPGEEAEFRELVERVRLEMAQLPHRQAEAIWLCCVEGATYEEAANQMKTDANHVGVLIHRARAHLRKMLADLDPARIVIDVD